MRVWSTGTNTLVWYRRPAPLWHQVTAEPTPVYDAMLAEGWQR